jgi:lipoate-protein ligase B
MLRLDHKDQSVNVREIVNVYTEGRKKHADTLWVKWRVYYIKAGGTYSNHCPSETSVALAVSVHETFHAES